MSSRELSASEVRVLGCLVEKAATTPDNYPLTLNSLRSACNQATSRDPVVAYSELEVEQALASLRGRGLTRTVHSTSNRATKYRHVLDDVLALDLAELAVLSVLMLRGAQTPGEIKARCERQHTFATLDDVTAILQALATRAEPLVRQLDRQPGQKDARWTHLLAAAETATSADTVHVQHVEHGASPRAERNDALDEFHDLLWGADAERRAEALLDALADLEPALDPSFGPVVDVGSATGITLCALGVALPTATFLAIEPSPTMRAVLFGRLAGDADLRARATVIATTLGEAPQPAQASAFVVTSCIDRLADAERRALWTAAGASPHRPPVLIGPPVDSAPAVREVNVGECRYRAWRTGDEAGESGAGLVPVVSVVEKSRNGALVGEHRQVVARRVDDRAALAAEVAPYGLAVELLHGWTVVRR